jgi:Fe-S oxidoreductase
MCPSYRATKEERFSTRGRGRLLNEMLRGEVITDGWRSEEVKEALDTCLGCKSCRSECPTHTDLAAYKAEFLSHYHEAKSRPLGEQIMARIGEWAPFASVVPWAANGLSRFAPGIAAERSVPKFKKSFRATFASGGQPKGERVVLFDDTFNNHFRPDTARSAQKLLEAAGCAVELPREHVCCGRPYYDFGMLDRAKRALDRVLGVLEPGVPVVMLEPGCLSVFRDELKQLFPNDPRAKALRVFSLSEYLLSRGKPVVKSDRQVVVHSHCHQKAIWGAKSDVELLKAAGFAVSTPDTGCCGMSGSFGYRHYETSKRIFGLALQPALAAAPRAEVVACGFSCREQIEDLGKRPTLHVADLLAG